MLKIDKLKDILEDFAPLSLSMKMIENGDYDNSGIIVKSSENVDGVLFCLDLTEKAVGLAKAKGINTIVTHHPAIYTPIKTLSYCDDTAALLCAIKEGFNVLSMHLNLDVADNGIDQSLAEALGAKSTRIISLIDQTHGYGREFEFEGEITDMVARIKSTLSTDKIIVYGEGNVGVVGSFCGGGASSAQASVLSGETKADTIVTSDMPHHIVKALVEKGKNIILIPHYVAEEYGFKKFFLHATERLSGEQTEYFEDKRFR